MLIQECLENRRLLDIARNLTLDMADSVEDVRGPIALMAVAALLVAVCRDHDEDPRETLEALMETLETVDGRQASLSFAH